MNVVSVIAFVCTGLPDGPQPYEAKNGQPIVAPTLVFVQMVGASPARPQKRHHQSRWCLFLYTIAGSFSSSAAFAASSASRLALALDSISFRRFS